MMGPTTDEVLDLENRVIDVLNEWNARYTEEYPTRAILLGVLDRIMASVRESE